MDNYKKLIVMCNGALCENDIIIGAKLAMALIEQKGNNISVDYVELQQSPRVLETQLYSKYETTREKYWSKIKNLQSVHRLAFKNAIKSYLDETYRVKLL